MPEKRESSNGRTSRRGSENEDQASGIWAWVEGIARGYDVRNKILYIEKKEDGTAIEATATVDVTDEHRNSAVVDHWEGGKKENGPDAATTRQHSYARGILDVRLISCASPRGEELFKQLQNFTRKWEEALACDMLGLAIDAAAIFGASCRFVLDGIASEVVEETVTGALHDEELAIIAAAEIAAATAALEAAKNEAKQRPITSIPPPTNGLKDTPTEADPLHQQHPQAKSSILTTTHMTETPATCKLTSTKAVDENFAAGLSFQCTVIVKEKYKAAEWIAQAGVGDQASLNSAKPPSERKRRDRQYLAEIRSVYLLMVAVTFDIGLCFLFCFRHFHF